MDLVDFNKLEKEVVDPALDKVDNVTIPAFFAKLNAMKDSLDGWTITFAPITITLGKPKEPQP